MIYRQCTLSSAMPGEPEPREECRLVEWVPEKLAQQGRVVECDGRQWQVVHVGQSDSDPRSAHESMI